tara:strand:- start:325 stop:2382 length:2058 start_codon:yes stop_codon:yes gene_type:complete
VIDLYTPVEQLPRVGPAVSQKLHRLGCKTLIDLVLHLPFRYEDKTRITPLRDALVGQPALYEGQIQSVLPKRHPKQPIRVMMSAQGAIAELVFFKLFPNQLSGLKVGRWIRCFGTVLPSSKGLKIAHPEFVTFDECPGPDLDETLTPVYPTTAGISQARIRALVQQSVHWAKPALLEEASEETLPISLMSCFEALCYIHFPKPDAPIDLESHEHHPAVKRLVFEEHAAYQFAMRKARQQMQQCHARPFETKEKIESAFVNRLSFTLTQAQNTVWSEIKQDLAKATPMMRLVQGDVGSGKTVLAGLAAFSVIQSGGQAAIMAPTELLANQLATQFKKWFEPFEIPVALLTGSIKGKARKQISEGLESGNIPVAVGTHALFQNPIRFQNLGLMVVDEQHRFGVEQRLALYQKGQGTHQLVMSATPIPRSLAMTMWADLDISIVSERPPGRQPIQTIAVPTSRKEDVIERLDAAIEREEQAFWVCTLVNENETLPQEAAVKAFESLTQRLPHRRVGCVHGQMPSAEKEKTLAAFRAGEIEVLVSTTVIEVGIDIPKATLMVIENPERLGLAQLHQLRGRVGRGQKSSFCVLLYDTPLSLLAKKRIEILRSSDDGFELAEEDLKLRGPGEVLGRRQTGARQFKIADIYRDRALIGDIQSLTDYLQTHQPKVVESWASRWHAGEIVLTQV